MLDNDKQVNAVESENTKFWIEDEVLHCYYKPHLNHITLDIAEEIVATRKRLTNGVPYPVLLDTSSTIFVDLKARKYMAHEDALSDIRAVAIVVRSPIMKLGANIFLHIDKPLVPSKIFSDITKAKQWLGKFK